MRNEEYPKKTDLLKSPGYVVVKWLPYQNKIFYNLISHNRLIPMTEQDYFFVTEAETSLIYKGNKYILNFISIFFYRMEISTKTCN